MHIQKWIHNKIKSIPPQEQDSRQYIIPKHFLEKIQQAKEEKLEELDLSSYQADNQQKLTKIPDQVFELTHLKSLNLSHNRLLELPIFFGALSNLITLDLSGNKLSRLPESFELLYNLTALNLSENRFNELPDFLKTLTNLKILDLRGNRLLNLPNYFSKFTKLTTLYLSYNELAEFPNSLLGLYRLNALYLSHNQIFSLPYRIDNLSNLTRLYLRNNKISNLPNSLAKLDKLTTLDLRDNPLENPPIQITTKGIGAIRNYFSKSLEESKEYIYEAKLLIIGKAGVGKTTLAKKIKNPNYQLGSKRESTKGIEMTQYSFPLENSSKKFKVNIWDFGGQEIYHATHQFFITKRSLYILVVDNSQQNEDLYYWLNVVKILSDNSPLLIIKNEKSDLSIEIENELALCKKFTNIKGILSTNFATNRGLYEIINQVEYYINNLEHIGKILPPTWIKIRQILEKYRRYYISLDLFLRICNKNGLTILRDQLELSRYLHDLGVCLHFQDQAESSLYKTVILKPTWATDAVYKLLDNQHVINNQGYFTRSDLRKIWHEDKYALMEGELLQLMLKFELCYQIPNNNQTFISPQLLSKNKPEYFWDNSDTVRLSYKYKYFMPKDIITRFIVAMHEYIEHQQYVWKNGVVLSKDNTRAEVIEYYDQREIIIRVSGAKKRSLVAIINEKLAIINHSYQKIYTVNSFLSQNN